MGRCEGIRLGIPGLAAACSLRSRNIEFPEQPIKARLRIPSHLALDYLIMLAEGLDLHSQPNKPPPGRPHLIAAFERQQKREKTVEKKTSIASRRTGRWGLSRNSTHDNEPYRHTTAAVIMDSTEAKTREARRLWRAWRTAHEMLQDRVRAPASSSPSPAARFPCLGARCDLHRAGPEKRDARTRAPGRDFELAVDNSGLVSF